MSNKSNHINVRFDDESYAIVESIADKSKQTKSDIVRQAVDGELANIAEQKNNSLSDTEREKVVNDIGKMMTLLSKIEVQNKRLGGNVNQIARAMNKGEIGVSQEDVESYDTYGKVFDDSLKQMSKGLNDLWHILV